MRKWSFWLLAAVLLIALTGCGQQNAAGNDEANEEVQHQVLVAYFSATNRTAGIAEDIAESLGVDLYVITPEAPYTASDLDYINSNSRTSKENADPDCRPAIGGPGVENMADYDLVFIGYPIWWRQAPKIICTFLESYDFSSKIIVPFCTSGSAGISYSLTDLQAIASDATWLEGKRFSRYADHETVVEWLNELDLGFNVE